MPVQQLVAPSILCLLSALVLPFATLLAQDASPSPVGTPEGTAIAATIETQKQARSFQLNIPAPRGQITDSRGEPLAQTRISNNLALEFPGPNVADDRVLEFAHEQLRAVRLLVDRPISVTDEQILKHYRNRGALPLDIIQDLSPADTATIRNAAPARVILHAVYQRFYPNGILAAHVIGYTGKSGRVPEGPIQNNDPLWPGSEGREGIEQTFNAQLTGRVGEMSISLDASGTKTSEKVVLPPQPGFNVITTINADIQRSAEQALQKGAVRGALVVVDPNNGDILALASWPSFNPNAFIPAITPEAYNELNTNPNKPLLPRAFRSAYPPGSTFKVIVGLAALESEAIKPDDEFGCPAAMQIGNRTFHNWKKVGSGSLNFVQALTQSCDTYFYQVGIKTGSGPIIEWATKAGLGAKTGIPVNGEDSGRVPSEEYMTRVHGHKMLGGDLANLAIGQGDLLVTPLQMAQAMAAIGNGGTRYQSRLVSQVQTLDGRVVTAYEVRIKEQLGISAETLTQIKKGMVAVVSSPSGTASAARIPNVDVAGKTGTAQWGPKNNERTAAWFAGFAPADKPKYAFAALYEGAAKMADVHGGIYAAPLVAKVMKELFKEQEKPKKGKHSKKSKKRDNPEATPTPVKRAEPVSEPGDAVPSA